MEQSRPMMDAVPDAMLMDYIEVIRNGETYNIPIPIWIEIVMYQLVQIKSLEDALKDAGSNEQAYFETQINEYGDKELSGMDEGEALGPLAAVDIIEYEVPWIPPKEVRGNSRAHHMAKARKVAAMRLSGYENALVIKQTFARAFPFEHLARITFAWHTPNAANSDVDNFAIGMKGWIDGLVDNDIFTDDSSEYLMQGEHRLIECSPGDEKTVITIEEVLDGQEENN